MIAITQAKIGRLMKKRGMERLLLSEKSPFVKGGFRGICLGR
jgi:hypothetical protein